MAVPSKRGPSAFILASLIETELNLIYLLPLAQASGRYERPSGRKLHLRQYNMFPVTS